MEGWVWFGFIEIVLEKEEQTNIVCMYMGLFGTKNATIYVYIYQYVYIWNQSCKNLRLLIAWFMGREVKG